MWKRFCGGWIYGSWVGVGLAAILATSTARADIVKKVVVEDGKVVSGYVLQGSRNGVKTSSSRSVNRKITPHFSLDPVVVPATVLPPLETEETSKQETPRPRFGYGSDFESSPEPSRHGEMEERVIPKQGSVNVPIEPLTPVYQFRTHYPQVEYWPAVPYYYYGGTSCGHHTSYSSLGYRRYGGHTSYSRFHASIATPFFSLHWHR